MNGKGTWTGQDLSDLTSLCAPWTITGGQLRPPFSQAAARLSLELAASAYDLHHNDEMNAGNIMTEYEEKFSSRGNPINKLIAVRKN